MVESGDFWKLTADQFGKLIEKPKMQEKFLKKPPPKYVYDMIISAMGVTGFPKGLFTDDELNSKYFDESPQNKLEIFQKTVDITKIVLNENFEIKTTNILKGEEPEKTNYFLQAFYRAATSGKDFSKFITKYLDHKKKKAEEKKKTKEEPAQPQKKEEEKKVEIKKEVSQPVEKETKPTSNDKVTKPSNNSSGNNTTAASKAPTGQVNTVRPMSGKRPDKIKSDTKEIVEDTSKTGGKVPQGLISEKNKKNEEEESKPLGNNTATATASSTAKGKTAAKEKDEDLAPSTQQAGKIKFAKIGKFADVTGGDDTSNKTSNKTFTSADLESIKNYVQEISKNSNPIGKIIDFLGDDIESMNKELQSWIKESKTYKDRFDEEVKRSDETLLPLQNELLELEETIRDEHMRIKSIKSRMIKNEQIIQNLINNVISIKNEDIGEERKEQPMNMRKKA